MLLWQEDEDMSWLQVVGPKTVAQLSRGRHLEMELLVRQRTNRSDWSQVWKWEGADAGGSHSRIVAMEVEEDSLSGMNDKISHFLRAGHAVSSISVV